MELSLIILANISSGFTLYFAIKKQTKKTWIAWTFTVVFILAVLGLQTLGLRW